MKTKRVKEAPSAMAFSSPAKRKLLSDLAKARDSVKNKFKKAYIERKKREREIEKVFKPLTKKLDTFTVTGKDKKNPSKKNGTTTNVKASPGSAQDGSYFDDDSLDGSAFDLSQFPEEYVDGTTPTTVVKSPTRGKWTGGRRSAEDLYGRYWQSPVLQELLKQNRTPKSSYTLPPSTPLTRRSVLEPSTPTTSRMLIEPSLPTSKRYTDRNKRDKRALEVRRLDTSLNDIEIPPSASRFRDLPERGAFRKQTYGKALGSNFIPYTANDRIIYEYFDDPNELCERLRLLTASKAAGNTNHIQEINSILEELRELGHIH